MDGSFLTADSVTLELIICASLHASLRHVMAPQEPELIAATQSVLVFIPATTRHVSEAALHAAWLKIVFCELAPRGGRNKTSSGP